MNWLMKWFSDKKILSCESGVHSWGRVKQWFVDGKVVHARKCKKCGKIDK